MSVGSQSLFSFLFEALPGGYIADEYVGVGTPTVITFTGVAVGVSAVYSYSGYTGPDPYVGLTGLVVTGFVAGAGANNGTFVLTAVDLINKTVTVALTTQVNETHAGSGTTATGLASGDNNVFLPASIVQSPLAVFAITVPDGLRAITKSWALDVPSGRYVVVLTMGNTAAGGCTLLCKVPATG